MYDTGGPHDDRGHHGEGWRTISSVEVQPGALLGQQYQIIRRLGGGGMGDVFLASDIALDRFVAIKVLRPELSSLIETDARFRREARLLSKLNHPNIVVLFAFGSEPSRPHYI